MCTVPLPGSSVSSFGEADAFIVAATDDHSFWRGLVRINHEYSGGFHIGAFNARLRLRKGLEPFGVDWLPAFFACAFHVALLVPGSPPPARLAAPPPGGGSRVLLQLDPAVAGKFRIVRIEKLDVNYSTVPMWLPLVICKLGMVSFGNL